MKKITDTILLNAGFEYLELETNLLSEYEKTNHGIDNYKIFRKWTDDKSPLKIDIDNGLNNRGTQWHLHIDNDCCESIGSADIDTIEQFNMLMKVFDSNFKL